MCVLSTLSSSLLPSFSPPPPFPLLSSSLTLFTYIYTLSIWLWNTYYLPLKCFKTSLLFWHRKLYDWGYLIHSPYLDKNHQPDLSPKWCSEVYFYTKVCHCLTWSFRQVTSKCCFHVFRIEMTNGIIKRKELERNEKIVMNAPNLLLPFKTLWSSV